MYFVVGGMPEPVLVWTEDQDIKEADRVLSNIIMSYENDFANPAEPTDVPKIQLSLQGKTRSSCTARLRTALGRGSMKTL